MENQDSLDSLRIETHSRFSGASWYKHTTDIVIGGAGGIGSWLSLFLARQGHNIHAFDFDTVEEHNVGGQFYAQTDRTASKVDALFRNVKNFGGKEMSTYNIKYEKGSLTGPVMMAAFDNMKARLDMFETWLAAFNPDSEVLQVFVDGRLNAETADYFFVTDVKSAERWRAEWFSDEKVKDAPCAFKATTHCAAVLAGMMTATFNNLTSNFYEEEMRSVPYKTTIWLPNLMLTTED